MPLFRPRPRPPSGVPEPCLPTSAKVPPAGPDWIHEIKHDGYRILARSRRQRADCFGQRARVAAGLADGKFVDIRIPYPPVSSARISMVVSTNPTPAGRGRGLWTTTGTRAYFHSEGGKDASPKLFKVQIRWDPLPN